MTLKTTTAQVVEASVTNSSLSEDYTRPDDHTKQITKIRHTLKVTVTVTVTEIATANIMRPAFAFGLSEIRQKTQRCRKNAFDGLENVYYL